MQIKTILSGIKPKTKSLLGIEINTHSIRVAELSVYKSTYQVEACISITKNTPITDKVVTETLKNIAASRSIGTKNTATAISHSLVTFKEISIEHKLTKKEIDELLKLNIEKYIGISENNISFDYQAINTSSKTGDRTILQLTAVPREHIEKHTKVLLEADFYPKIIDINSCALERIARYQLKSIDELAAIINIDPGSVLIIIIDKNSIIYSHEDFINVSHTASANQIIEFLKSKMQPVFSKIAGPITKILLAGEMAVLSELPQKISAEFSIQTEVINPFFDMKLSPSISTTSLQNMSPAMCVCVGLAMRVYDDSKN